MPIEMLTYAALGTHLKISAEAARAWSGRSRLRRRLDWRAVNVRMSLLGGFDPGA